jgi:3-oxoacyl-[acyl-carrier-protein] synthase III
MTIPTTSTVEEKPVRLMAGAAALPRRTDHSGNARVLSSNSHIRELFTGDACRHILDQQRQTIDDLATEASRRALAETQLPINSIDRLYGYISVSEFVFPNGLFAVHRNLGLPSHCLTIPINSEFTNLLLGITHAWEAISAGRSELALVTVGTHLSSFADPRSAASDYISDAATAFVVGRSDKGLVILDMTAEVLSDEYGAMTMAFDPTAGHPLLEVGSEAGQRAFLSTGRNGPVRLVRRLMNQHQIRADQLTLITHQPSRLLLDFWAAEIRPHRHLDTFAEHGNMAQASVGVTLAEYWHRLETPFVVLVGLGLGAHNVAVLLKVDQETS